MEDLSCLMRQLMQIGSSVLSLKQCVQMLGYKKSPVLELFKTSYSQDITICLLLFKILER